jgi:serralysin
MAVLFAGDFDDTLLTTANSDPVVGRPGNDYLFSRTNSDTLNQNSVDDLAVTGSIGKGADGIDQSNSTETITAPQSQLSLLNGVPTPTTTVTFTGDDNIDSLLFGTKWQGTTVSFSFPDSINDYEAGYLDRASHGVSFKILNPAQRLITGAWLQMYGDVSNIGFTELTGVSDRDATIRMAMSDVPPWAFQYEFDGFVEDGDIWFNKTDFNNPVLGTYAYHTFGHELGHALGLKHGHALEGVSGVVMNADRDSMEFSIMTYRSYIGGLTTGYTNEAGGYAQSLMMYDIAAIQHLYGADFDFNSGDTTYTFSTTTGLCCMNNPGSGVSPLRPVS